MLAGFAVTRGFAGARVRRVVRSPRSPGLRTILIEKVGHVVPFKASIGKRLVRCPRREGAIETRRGRGEDSSACATRQSCRKTMRPRHSRGLADRPGVATIGHTSLAPLFPGCSLELPRCTGALRPERRCRLQDRDRATWVICVQLSAGGDGVSHSGQPPNRTKASLDLHSLLGTIRART
jgi:hypothetical protein